MAFPRRLTWAEAQDYRDRYAAGAITLTGIAIEVGWAVRSAEKLIKWQTYRNPTSTPIPTYRVPPKLTRCAEHGLQLRVEFSMIGETIYVCPMCL